MKKIKKTVIITGYRCNNKCVFCINAHRRHLPVKSTSEIVAEIIDARRRGATYLEFIGGEVTIRSDVLRLFACAKEAGYETISMATNGRMFAYPSFCRQIIAAGLTRIIFSIHGPRARLHDALTRQKGSFHQLLQGIRNMTALKFPDIDSNTTIVKQNYRHLPEIGRLIYDLGIRNAEFIFVDPTVGAAHADFHRMVPRLRYAAPYIRRCLDIGRVHKVDHWAARYVPLCHFIGYERQVSELLEEERFDTEHFAPDFANLSVSASRRQVGRIKPSKCRPCKKFKACEGIWKEYYRQYGDGELSPIL